VVLTTAGRSVVRQVAPWGGLHMWSFRDTSCLQILLQTLLSKLHKLLCNIKNLLWLVIC
jgi:hypothetical protein